MNGSIEISSQTAAVGVLLFAGLTAALGFVGGYGLGRTDGMTATLPRCKVEQLDAGYLLTPAPCRTPRELLQ